MKSARRSIKDTSDNKRRWRDKFKQQCSDRIKHARQEKIDKIREDQVKFSFFFSITQNNVSNALLQVNA
jgi:hypothetical protein